jgi:hypothetical protein
MFWASGCHFPAGCLAASRIPRLPPENTIYRHVYSASRRRPDALVSGRHAIRPEAGWPTPRIWTSGSTGSTSAGRVCRHTAPGQQDGAAAKWTISRTSNRTSCQLRRFRRRFQLMMMMMRIHGSVQKIYVFPEPFDFLFETV